MHIGIVATVTVLTLALVSGKVVPKPEVPPDCPHEETTSGQQLRIQSSDPLFTSLVASAASILGALAFPLASALSGTVSGLSLFGSTAENIMRYLEDVNRFEGNYDVYIRE